MVVFLTEWKKSSIMILKLLVFNIYGPLFNSSKILNPLLSEALILPFPLSMLTFYIQNHLQLEKQAILFVFKVAH